MSCQQSKMSGTKFTNAMVDQRPKFESSVYSRKLKVVRPRLKRKKAKFL